MQPSRPAEPNAANPSHRPGRCGFNGELIEVCTGRYLLGMGYRAYSPLLMHFSAPDSLSPFDERGGLNAYAYCLGNPVSLIDPDGHSTVSSLMSYVSMRTGFPMRKLTPTANGGVVTPFYYEPSSSKKIPRVDSVSSLEEARTQASSRLRKKPAPEVKPAIPDEVPDAPPPTLLNTKGVKPFWTSPDGVDFYQAGLLLHPAKGPSMGKRLRDFAVREVNRLLRVGQSRKALR